MQEGEVDLLVDVDGLVDEHRVNGKALGCRLVRDQIVADHTLCLLRDDLWSVNDVDTTLHSAREMALTATSSLHLSFDNETF